MNIYRRVSWPLPPSLVEKSISSIVRLCLSSRVRIGGARVRFMWHLVRMACTDISSGIVVSVPEFNLDFVSFRFQILPNRFDWMGDEHEQTYTELVSSNFSFFLLLFFSISSDGLEQEKYPGRFSCRLGRFCFGVLQCVTHAAIETSSVIHSWRSLLLLCFFFFFVSVWNENVDFFTPQEILPADKFAFWWSFAYSRTHWPVFVIDTVCTALAFVVYVDGGGHIYLSLSTHCCYTTTFAGTQRMY